MATTSPDNIRTPDPGDAYNLVPDLANMAGDIQAALIKRANSYTGTTTQMNATSAPNGSTWWNTSNNFLYERRGGAWVRHDTGWTVLALSPGFTAVDPSFPPRVRRIGNVGYLWGGVTGPPFQNVALWPSGFLPVVSADCVVAGDSDSSFARIRIFDVAYQLRSGTMGARAMVTIPMSP